MTRIAIVLFAFMLCLTATAQDTDADMEKERIVRVGLCLGPGLSNFISDDEFASDDYQWRFRFHASVFQDILLKKPFFLHTEINYSALGTMFPVDILDSSGNMIGRGKYKYSLHYIQIPVLAKLKFGRLIRGYAAVGPYIGFLVAARGSVDPSIGADMYPTVNLADDYSPFDLGVKVHAGMEIPILNEQRLMFEARYSQGFWDISRSASRDWNSAFTFMFGYMFEL